MDHNGRQFTGNARQADLVQPTTIYVVAPYPNNEVHNVQIRSLSSKVLVLVAVALRKYAARS